MMMVIMILEGQVALITGGGRRLGRGITEALARAGCQIIIHYGRSRQKAESTAEELANQGTTVECLQADLRERAQIEELFESVRNRFGRLDVLVNSAASFHQQALMEIEPEIWDRAMNTNLKAAFVCLQQAVPLMLVEDRSSGSPAVVVNIADLSGVFAWPGYTHHGVSKAGLLQLTRSAARELAPRIRVNAVIPGPILPPPGADPSDAGWTDLVNTIPMARPGLPSEVGSAVVFLASNDFITGESVLVDGGEHLLGAGHRQL